MTKRTANSKPTPVKPRAVKPRAVKPLKTTTKPEETPSKPITATKTKKAQVKWETDVAGDDNLSSDARLLVFLLDNNAKNLNLLTPTKNQKGAYRVHMSKRRLALKCLDYFCEKKVTYRTMEDIRARMKKYMVDYSKAGLLFLQTGNGAKGETKDTGSKEFEKMVKAVFPYYYELEEFLQDRRVGLGVPDILGAQDSEVEETVEEEEDETRHVESTPTEEPVSTSVVETVSDSSEDEATVAPPAKKAKKSSGAATFDQDFKSILDEPVDTTIYSQMLEKKQEMAKMKMKVQQLTHQLFKIS